MTVQPHQSGPSVAVVDQPGAIRRGPFQVGDRVQLTFARAPGCPLLDR